MTLKEVQGGLKLERPTAQKRRQMRALEQRTTECKRCLEQPALTQDTAHQEHHLGVGISLKLGVSVPEDQRLVMTRMGAVQ